MADIVLSTLNAKYSHPAFGLRYLLANLGPLRNLAALLESDIKRDPADVVGAIVALKPKIVGLGVYLWNVTPLTRVVVELKRDHPEIVIVLGGPEVSFEADLPGICMSADYVVTGEADFAFFELCRKILAGDKPPAKIIHARPAAVDRLILPYELYDEKDIAHRMTYVESSRGCPFECEYCVSCDDAPVRYFALPRLFEEFERLLDRGARHFKFIDRTFNAKIDHAVQVMDYFLARMRPGLFLHFEMMPDRFPNRLRSVIARFPADALHFEIGIQTYNEEVAQRIRRRQKMASIDDHLRFLRNETGALIHADLIAGLPGESMESFAAGFDRLVALRPHELQVGILKRLRGAPIGRHDGEWGMVYTADPPYEILENKVIDRESMGRIKRFARYWELIANRRNFEVTLPLISGCSPFHNFMRLSDWLFGKTGRDFGIALRDFVELLFTYLTTERKLDRQTVARAILRDYQRNKRRETPSFLR
jgi:radical SAM superfamily enzyme YgiQ (UPF0313 family)